MVTVLSCKEAMFKAWGASGEAYELSLRMLRHGARGRAVALGTGPEVVASWEIQTGSILTFAVAAPAGRAWQLLETVISASRSLRAANAPGGGGGAAAAVPGRSDSPGDS